MSARKTPPHASEAASSHAVEASRIDPWGSVSVKDYGKLEKEFGMEPFGPFAAKLPEPLVCMRRGVVFGQRDFGMVADRIRQGKPFVMMTGLMPSGKFHMGHKMLADQIIYYQKHGGKIYLCVADTEAYNMRMASLPELRRIAVEEYLLNYIALGLKPKNCRFYFQSSRSKEADKSNAYYRLIGMISRKITFNEMSAVYGELSPGKMISAMTQYADILHPQLPEFEGKVPVVVPVGADQDPHIRLARDVASRFSQDKGFDFIPPAATYHKFMPGLKGVETKMSSSDPYSYIALTDSPKEAKDKIMKYAFSGGGNSVEEHRKRGGKTGVDIAYHMLFYMFEPDDGRLARIKQDYESGRMLTGELKQLLAEKLTGFLERHHDAREKAKDSVSDFLDC